MRSTRLVASSIAAVSVGLGRFDGFHAVPAAVSKTCLAQFDKNKWSVPARAVGRPVELRAYADRSSCARTAGLSEIKGRERNEGFIEALGRRLQKGQSHLQEIPDDIAGSSISESTASSIDQH